MGRSLGVEREGGLEVREIYILGLIGLYIWKEGDQRLGFKDRVRVRERYFGG